jgi:hypothetical protein
MIALSAVPSICSVTVAIPNCVLCTELPEAVTPVLETDHLMFATDGMQLDWEGTNRSHMATRLTNFLRNGTSFTELLPGLYFYAQPKIEKLLCLWPLPLA